MVGFDISAFMIDAATFKVSGVAADCTFNQDHHSAVVINTAADIGCVVVDSAVNQVQGAGQVKYSSPPSLNIPPPVAL